MRELRFNVNYLLLKKEFYLFILGVLLVNFIHVYLVISHYASDANLQTGEYHFILNNPTITLSSIVIMSFPILSSLVLSDSIWLENKEKTTIFLHSRLDIRRNSWCRLLLSFLITFVVIFIGFMFNYFSLVFIMGSGNIMSHFQELAYALVEVPEFFLDHIRFTQPTVYILLISAHVSFILGLLSAFSLASSYFVKQRIVLYFQIPLLLVIWEVVISILGFDMLSIVNQLQPFSKFSFSSSLIVYGILIFITIILQILGNKKKDILL